MSLESELTNLASFQNISYDAKATVASWETAQKVFCAGWPATKQVLEAIESMVKNPIVRIVIGIIVKAGDALAAKICNPS